MTLNSPVVTLRCCRSHALYLRLPFRWNFGTTCAIAVAGRSLRATMLSGNYLSGNVTHSQWLGGRCQKVQNISNSFRNESVITHEPQSNFSMPILGSVKKYPNYFTNRAQLEKRCKIMRIKN